MALVPAATDPNREKELKRMIDEEAKKQTEKDSSSKTGNKSQGTA